MLMPPLSEIPVPSPAQNSSKHKLALSCDREPQLQHLTGLCPSCYPAGNPVGSSSSRSTLQASWQRQDLSQPKRTHCSPSTHLPASQPRLAPVHAVPSTAGMPACPTPRHGKAPRRPRQAEPRVEGPLSPAKRSFHREL